MATPKQKAAAGGGLVGLAAIIAALLAALNGGNPPAPPGPTTTRPAVTTTAAPTTSTSTSTTVAPTTVPSTTAPPPPPPLGSVRPWFSASATWNRPAAEFGPAPQLQGYVDRLWNHGGGPAPAGTINVAGGDYSVPVYRASDATAICRIYQTSQSQGIYVMGFAGLQIGDPVPCNPAWKPGTGNDNIMAIIDEQTGRVWEIGGVGQLPINCGLDIFGRNGRAGLTFANVNDFTSMCTTGGARYDGLYTADDGSKIDGRGAGMPKLSLLTRADEVKSGVIRHALQMTIAGTMFGLPSCAPIRGATAPGFGVTCGGFVPPATKLERVHPDVGCAKQAVTDTERAKTVPEGMRFALRITDAEIEQWLTSKGYTGPLRNTARIFAVALRDYGWIIAETGCWGMLIELESATVGPAVPTWRELGLKPDANGFVNLTDGLITPARMYVVEPPK